MKSKTLSWQKTTDRNKLVDSLKKNEVSLVTTDTIPGLLARMTPEGHQKLNQIKGRAEKPYLILISSKEQLATFIDQKLTPELQKLVDECWPGPITLIFKGKSEYASFAQSKDGTIGLRVPDHEGLRDILKHFKGLFSTSANKTGKPSPTQIHEVEPSIQEAVAFIVQDEGKKQHLASTILDCTGPEIKVIREGAYSVQKIAEVLGQQL